jgi:hypothetical protein
MAARERQYWRGAGRSDDRGRIMGSCGVAHD